MKKISTTLTLILMLLVVALGVQVIIGLHQTNEALNLAASCNSRLQSAESALSVCESNLSQITTTSTVSITGATFQDDSIQDTDGEIINPATTTQLLGSEQSWSGLYLKCPDGSVTDWDEYTPADIVPYYEWGCYQIDPFTGAKMEP